MNAALSDYIGKVYIQVNGFVERGTYPTPAQLHKFVGNTIVGIKGKMTASDSQSINSIVSRHGWVFGRNSRADESTDYQLAAFQVDAFFILFHFAHSFSIQQGHVERAGWFSSQECISCRTPCAPSCCFRACSSSASCSRASCCAFKAQSQ